MDFAKLFLALFTLKEVIFPNISVANIDVSKKYIPEAVIALSNSVKVPSSINIRYNDEVFSIDTKDINLEYDFLASIERAYQFVKTGNIAFDISQKIKTLLNHKNFGLISTYDIDKLNEFISVVSSQVGDEPIYPEISIVNKEIIVKNGVKGVVIDKQQLLSKISDQISQAKEEEITLPTKALDPSLSESEINSIKERSQKLIGKKLEIKFEYETLVKTDKDMVNLIDTKGGYKNQELKKFVDEASRKFNREPQNPKFEFSNNRVNEFLPALDGIKVDNQKLANLIISAIENDNYVIELPAIKTPPSISTDKVNNLGIKELIGRGTSTYFHSIPGRVHNVSLAASRINGTLVAPKETFSFNDTLGDVSKFTGYQSAYVILSGKTVLGDGGGVCQVSSTLFRAVLDAGLPITQRTAHAYRVGYYEQGSPPGFDATVYAPSPDFKFTNDTNDYILITAKADPKNYSLVFEIYGTSDGRIAEVSRPVISSSVAPAPDVYQDDPSLPIGTVKQVEYRAYGAKVSFNYKVTRDGEELFKKTFVSNYRPWSAVYLRGTASQ